METKQSEPKFKTCTKIVIIPIFADGSKSITDPEYFKILLSDDEKVLSKNLGVMHNEIHDCIKEILFEHLKIDPNWPFIKLNSARKNKNEVELIYTANMIYIPSCAKKGKIVNVNQFMSLKMDEYYVQSVLSASPGIYGG